MERIVLCPLSPLSKAVLGAHQAIATVFLRREQGSKEYNNRCFKN